jgi:Zn-dependent M16 (insulinase) family peptidase
MTGYELLSRKEVPEYRCAATHLRHTRTGCEVLHLASEDEENLFAFCFATPPRDDTGVSHITEHSVLSGSRRFPLKEPFAALLKGSLNTFLNALTYPDRTVYPAASCNRADFFNLLAVYGDAVFFPLLRKETFMQEAWRLEEASGEAGGEVSPAPGLQYAGVVYNEMKGAYSSPESIVGEWAYRSLFPDTPYRFDSGGDPKVITSLTHEGLREFHARYYHPSNCRIFLYGNIPAEDTLRVIDEELLSRFTAQRIEASIPLQPRWSEPQRLEKSFPVRSDTPLEKRATVCMSWLVSPVTDALALLTYELLAEVLVGSPGSPLRRALVDSGLGEDLSPVSGLETDLRECVFAVGLRGTDPEKEPEVERLILQTLSGLASRGIDAKLVESMLNRVEFRSREIRGNGGPYALRLMSRALRGWAHGMDPVDSLAFAPAMERLRASVAKGDGYLEGVIRRQLLQSMHRVSLVVRPDAGQEQREQREAKAGLEALEAGLAKGERERILDEARRFREFQLTPDSREDAARIPSVRRGDVKREVEIIPVSERVPIAEGPRRASADAPLFFHDIFTNGIVYLDLCFPAGCLDERQQLLLPLFGRAVCGCGLPGMSYSDVSLELFRLTGGFFAQLDAGGVAGHPQEQARHAFFRTRCLRQNLGEAVDLVGRLLAQADFRDSARLRDIILEHRNGMKSALIPSGHQYASLRAGSMLSASVAQEEAWRGVTQLAFVNELASGLEQSLPRIAEELEGIRAALARGGNLLVNATATADCFPDIEAAAERLAGALPKGTSAPADDRSTIPDRTVLAESLVTTATVGYVARAVPGFLYEDTRSGQAAVLGHLLTTGRLWEKVRMEGGAYGVFSYPRNLDGLFLFGSYRDPRVAPTLRAFRESLEEAAAGGLDEEEVERALIGTAGGEDRPLDPGEKGFVSLQRKLHGVTDAMRQARRDGLLAADGRSLAAAAAAILAGWGRGASAVIANRGALADAAREMPELGARVTELPE